MLAAADAMPRLPMTRTEIREMDAHRSLCLRVAIDTDDRHTGRPLSDHDLYLLLGLGTPTVNTLRILHCAHAAYDEETRIR